MYLWPRNKKNYIMWDYDEKLTIDLDVSYIFYLVASTCIMWDHSEKLTNFHLRIQSKTFVLRWIWEQANKPLAFERLSVHQPRYSNSNNLIRCLITASIFYQFMDGKKKIQNNARRSLSELPTNKILSPNKLNS